MVEMLYGAPQGDILQGWFISCSIVSRYSTTMTNEMCPLLTPQLKEKLVEILYGASQWNILQVWFILCSIMSRYSTVMTNEMFPLLALQLQ